MIHKYKQNNDHPYFIVEKFMITYIATLHFSNEEKPLICFDGNGMYCFRNRLFYFPCSEDCPYDSGEVPKGGGALEYECCTHARPAKREKRVVFGD